jgi:hypothetical protein
MPRAVFGRAALFATLAPFLLPLGAAAQSGIAGIVKDQGGAVLPGVAVEATSPALIEKIRSVMTDDQGRYSIVDLRPGIYRITFALQGFSTVAREGLELPSNFTATINVDLQVGSLEERVTVTGQSPLVDVDSTQKTTVLTRELLDAVPTGRTYAAVAALAVGIKVNSSNVGGARTAGQQRLLVHGLGSVDNTVQVDGMKMNTVYLDGDTQANHNDGMSQEITVQTSSPGADISGAGVVLNLIPREGGNSFSGSMFFGWVNSSMQGRNLTPELRAQGLATGDAVQYIEDSNPSVGGPSQAGQALVLRVVQRRSQCQQGRELVPPRRIAGLVRPERSELHRSAHAAGHASRQSHHVCRSRVQARASRVHFRYRAEQGIRLLECAALLHGRGEMDVDRDEQIAARGGLGSDRPGDQLAVPARRVEGARDA